MAHPPMCMHIPLVLAASQPRTPAAPCTPNMRALSARPRELAASQPRILIACRAAASQPCGPASQACRIVASRYRSLAASLATAQPCGLVASARLATLCPLPMPANNGASECHGQLGGQSRRFQCHPRVPSSPSEHRRSLQTSMASVGPGGHEWRWCLGRAWEVREAVGTG